MSIVEYFKNKKNSKTKETKKIVVKNPFEKFADPKVIEGIKKLGKSIFAPEAKTAVEPIPSNRVINPFTVNVQGGQLSLFDEYVSQKLRNRDCEELKF